MLRCTTQTIETSYDTYSSTKPYQKFLLQNMVKTGYLGGCDAGGLGVGWERG